MTEKTKIEFAPLSAQEKPVRIAFSESNGIYSPSLKSLDGKANGGISRAAQIAKFTGSKKACMDLIAPAGLELERLMVMGLGVAAKYGDSEWLALGGRIRGRLGSVHASSVEILLEAAEGTAITGEQAAYVALGTMLRAYQFKKYKTKKKDNEDEESDIKDLTLLRILCRHPEEAASRFEALAAVGHGVLTARDLVNEPPNILTPAAFAERAAALASHGLEVEILDQNHLKSIGMNALLAVGQGSEQPSAVAILRWNGAKDASAKPLALIGKGVCFDTGGLSMKPAAGMEDMKGDMGGAAAVMGAMIALAGRKAPVNAVGLLGLTENMPSGSAQRPSDIVTSLSGQTVEVLNTDAEGRLVLADVMWYAQERFQPESMITLATLTGAVIVALGKEYAGLFSNNDELADKLQKAGKDAGEKLWRLPLDAKYDKMLNSKVADMKNIGGREAGSITAAQFLQRFVKPGVAWAHIDIAGTAMGSPSTDINQGWASGFGVMLLDRLGNQYGGEDA